MGDKENILNTFSSNSNNLEVVQAKYEVSFPGRHTVSRITQHEYFRESFCFVN